MQEAQLRVEPNPFRASGIQPVNSSRVAPVFLSSQTKSREPDWLHRPTSAPVTGNRVCKSRWSADQS